MGKNNTINSYTDFFYHAFRNILLASLPILVISALILSLPHSSAETISSNTSSSDELTLILSSSCTLRSEVEEAHTATLNGGQYEEGIGITRVNTYCNDNNGYSIYAIGSSNNIDGNTDLVSNINDNYNISTGLYNSSAITPSSPSTWSMKLTAGTGTGINPDTGASAALTPPNIVNGFNNYSLVPSTYTLVASRSSATDLSSNTDVTGSYFTTTYDIYASSYQPAGTYSGRVKYLILHPQSTTNTIPDIDAAFTIAGEQKVYSDENGSYYAMQDMTTDICNSVSQNGERTSTQLVDIRDYKLYWVTKLKDGHCWMTSNLDLDIGGTGVAALTSENTDISTTASGSGIYANGYTESGGVWTWIPVSTAITANTTITYPNNTSNPTVSPAWSTSNYTTPYSAEGGDTYYYTSNTADNDTRYTSLKACTDAHPAEAECEHYHAGNYYNWTAAIASNNSTNISTAGTIAANSICPKGWRLPSASQSDNINNEFGRMLFGEGITAALSNGDESVGYYNGVTSFNKLRSNPYYFVRSGGIVGGTLYDSSVYGNYWSSTVSSSAYAYYLYFNGADVYPSRNNNRYAGRSLRCVTR